MSPSPPANENLQAVGAELSPTQQAILDIRSLRTRLDASELRWRAPIAIIGMACRFPGRIDGPRALWHALNAGTDAIGEIPPDRWDLATYYDADPDAPGKMSTRYGGFLTDVDRFDADFFGISDREATSIDPQQRLLLEVGWEALEDAGLPAERLFGTSAGVFVGISSFDYAQLRAQHSERVDLDAYHATGIAHSAASGRLAYYLGLQGPSMSIDTACSSSLVAVHLACQSLRATECQLALCGGVNLILSPEIHIALSKARMMAPDGRCKAFDDRADGFVRSEGCGIIVLKLLSDALSDGDRIHAVIRGSACNQDGRSSGLTAPNGPSQTAVLRAAWRAAGVRPEQLDYVEAHGTGTALGDPIEAGALSAALQGLPPEQLLALGSLKSNLGHMEAAAGIGGLIKTVLALEHERLPASLHLRTPNRNVSWQHSHLKVLREPIAWPRTSRRRLAGVSSFGFSGTNVHVVLEEPPQPLAGTRSDRSYRERSAHVLTLSARSHPALRALAARYAQALRSEEPDAAKLAEMSYTANVRRSHFAHRAAFVADSAPEALSLLDALAVGSAAELLAGRIDPLKAPELVVVAGAALDLAVDLRGDLYATLPAFATAIDQCAAWLEAESDRSVRAAIEAFALQWALAQNWRSWGIEPTVLCGAGIGAYVSASLAGVLSLEDGLRLASARARFAAQIGVPPSSRESWQLVARSVRCSPARVPLYWSDRPHPFAAGEVPDVLSWPPLTAEAPYSAVDIDTLAAGDNRIVLELGADQASVRALLQMLAALYVRGAEIDWKAVDRGQSRHGIELPGYPWHRQRYWFPLALPPAAAGRELMLAERWTSVLAAGQQQAQQIPIDLLLHTYAEKYQSLDQLATAYILRAYRTLGAFSNAGATLRAADLLADYGVLPTYRTLMQRWLEKLAKEGVLVALDGAFTAAHPLPDPDPVSLERAAVPLFADAPMLLEYVKLCGRLLASILVGHTSALDTLFPGGGLELAEAIYHRAALSRYFNAIAGAVAGAFAQRHRGVLRVLEVGAGTGGTTASILPLLPAERSEYTVTDVSDFFLRHAERRFKSWNGLKLGLLDLERTPESQGYVPGHYDLVVAANVLHATADLGQTLDFVRRLLADDGVLVLYEVTDPPSYFDVSIALIEGWHKYSDGIRQSTPLLTVEGWNSCLLQHGFDEVACWPGAANPAQVLGSRVFVAKATDHAAVVPAPPVAAQLAESAAVSTNPRYVEDAMPEIRANLADAPKGEQLEILIGFVRGQVTRVLRRRQNADIPREQRLMDLGLDSLMAVELRNNLSRDLQLTQTLPATLIFDYPSIADIAGYVLTLWRTERDLSDDGVTIREDVTHDGSEQIGVAHSTPLRVKPARDAASAGATAALLEQLSDAEIEQMLNDKLDRM